MGVLDTSARIRDKLLAEQGASGLIRADYRSTIAQGVADFAVGQYFTTAESGALRVYQRIAAAPFYQDQGDGAAPSTAGAVGFRDKMTTPAFLAADMAAEPRVSLAKGSAVAAQTLIELQDGETKRLSLDELALLAQAGNLNPTIRFYAQPLWIENVTAIAAANVNVSDNNEANRISTVAQLTLANPRTIEKGRFYKLISNDLIPERYATNARLGEVVSPAIGGANLGTFTTTAPLRDTGYATSAKLVAYKMARVVIVGGAVRPLGADTGAKVGPQIELMGLVGSLIEDMGALDAYAQIVRLIGCVDTEVRGLKARNGVNNATTGNLTYGVADFGSEATRMVGGDFRNTRHAFTSDSFDYPDGDQTGLNVWKYGRTRGAIVTGLTGRGNSNALMDTHDEADGVVASDCTSFGSYVGSSSGGSGAQMRGRHVAYHNVNSVGCQQGMAIKTYRDGWAYNCTHVDTVEQPIIFASGNSVEPQDVEGGYDGGEYSCLNVQYPSMVTAQLNAAAIAAGKSIRASIIGGARLKVRGDASVLRSLIRLYENASLRLDATIDLREATNWANGSTGLSEGVLRLMDTSVVSGRLRMQLGSAPVRQLLTATTYPCLAKVDLAVEIEGDVDFTDATLYRHLGFDPTNWPNVRITGYKRIGSARTPLNVGTYTPTLGETIRGIASGDSTVTLRLQPGLAMTGSTNSLKLDTALYAPGQTLVLINDSLFVVQIEGQGTIGPGASMTLYYPNGATTFRLVGISGPAGSITNAAGFTTGTRDHMARYALDATVARTVTLSNTAPPRQIIDFFQVSSGAFTFAAGAGAPAPVARNGLKTAGQGAKVRAECVDNPTGSAAVWRLSGDLVP